MIDVPHSPSEVFHTTEGTPYLKGPGVALVSQPHVRVGGIVSFLYGFDEELGFRDYFGGEVHLAPGDEVCKIAGQLCYLSFGPNRTKNVDAEKYFDNIKSSGHGSVLEHANFGFAIWGVDRAFTHELVRHRAGFAYSQVSQRYVSGKTLRFVMRREYQDDERLAINFRQVIDRARLEYDERAKLLADRMLNDPAFTALSPTERRKAVNSAARNCLPNETEAPIFVTANARAWRHFVDMRASKHADTPIREVATIIAGMLKMASPAIFSDLVDVELPNGTMAVDAKWKKV